MTIYLILQGWVASLVGPCVVHAFGVGAVAGVLRDVIL